MKVKLLQDIVDEIGLSTVLVYPTEGFACDGFEVFGQIDDLDQLVASETGPRGRGR